MHGQQNVNLVMKLCSDDFP